FGAAWAAWIVDVEVNPENGAVRVAKVWVAHDCGQMVNPDGVRHQVHGNVIQSTSRVLKEFATFDRRGVTSLEWGGYPILGFPELPEIDVLLLDRPEQPPMGAGESASVPAPRPSPMRSSTLPGRACDRCRSLRNAYSRRCAARRPDPFPRGAAAPRAVDD
ncbi:nicotinate dehydrogenase subunit B, partial [Pseudomonas aeruginosa]